MEAALGFAAGPSIDPPAKPPTELAGIPATTFVAVRACRESLAGAEPTGRAAPGSSSSTPVEGCPAHVEPGGMLALGALDEVEASCARARLVLGVDRRCTRTTGKVTFGAPRCSLPSISAATRATVTAGNANACWLKAPVTQRRQVVQDQRT